MRLAGERPRREVTAAGRLYHSETNRVVCAVKGGDKKPRVGIGYVVAGRRLLKGVVPPGSVLPPPVLKPVGRPGGGSRSVAPQRRVHSRAGHIGGRRLPDVPGCVPG